MPEDRPDRKPGACYDCNQGPSPNYGVRNDVWKQAWPDYDEAKKQAQKQHAGTLLVHLLLCYDCLEARLGRNLVPEDFDLSAPGHQGIVIGLMLAGHKVDLGNLDFNHPVMHGLALGLMLGGVPLSAKDFDLTSRYNANITFGLKMGQAREPVK